MKGWHRDNYRHSLAARGFALRGRPKKLDAIERVYKPFPERRIHSLVPLDRGISAEQYNLLMSDTRSMPEVPIGFQEIVAKDLALEHAKLSPFPFKFGKEVTKRGRPKKGQIAVKDFAVDLTDEQLDTAINNIDNMSDADLESMSAGDIEAMLRRARNIDPAKKEILVDALKRKTEGLLKVMKKAHKIESSKYVPINEVVEEKVVDRPRNTDTVVEKSVVYTDDDLDKMYKQFGNRSSMALREYLDENLSGNGNPDKLGDFWDGTSHTLFRPMDDLDQDWHSYNSAAGKNVINNGTIDRYMNRGAALVGRVVTLANVEPLLDHSEGRNFRDTMVDLAFGRRLN